MNPTRCLTCGKHIEGRAIKRTCSAACRKRLQRASTEPLTQLQGDRTEELMEAWRGSSPAEQMDFLASLGPTIEEWMLDCRPVLFAGQHTGIDEADLRNLLDARGLDRTAPLLDWIKATDIREHEGAS